MEVLGDDLDSTRITKPEMHAEMSTNLVNSKSKYYSCQRRQLRSSRLSRLAVRNLTSDKVDLDCQNHLDRSEVCSEPSC